uniref:Uncharacterized protein n=1 Tax=uncultured prokaryote TaxID=198431 RepID=A0A0H5PZC5_9ZZZZ|nr:hypothetical protein [uncultured prokaryote]
MQTKEAIQLEGKYKLDNDYLKSDNLTLKVGTRHRAKRGQAKRFIGAVDSAKPEPEAFSYISSLYAVQGSKNSYELESGGVYYRLVVTGLNTVEIQEKQKEKALVFSSEMAVL